VSESVHTFHQSRVLFVRVCVCVCVHAYAYARLRRVRVYAIADHVSAVGIIAAGATGLVDIHYKQPRDAGRNLSDSAHARTHTNTGKTREKEGANVSACVFQCVIASEREIPRKPCHYCMIIRNTHDHKKYDLDQEYNTRIFF
jgi:hypothetical protein